jgi:hypothetical protein
VLLHFGQRKSILVHLVTSCSPTSVWLYILPDHPEALPLLRAIAIKPRSAGLVARSRSAGPRPYHLLGHVQDQLTISIFRLGQQTP